MEHEPPVVALPSPDRHNVRIEIIRFPVVHHGNRQDTHVGCFVPDWVGAHGFEEVFYEILDVVLGLEVLLAIRDLVSH